MDYKLADLIDVPKLQELMDAFHAVTSAPTAILDVDGTVLTATAWQPICTQYHRVHPDCELRCKQSDAYIADHLEAGASYTIYECANGLVDVASPILVNGEHVGTVFTGQFLLQKPDEQRFRRQAQEFGFDERDYMQALAHVPVVERKQIEPLLNYLSLFTGMLARLGLQQLQQLETQQKIVANEKHYRMARFSLDNVADSVHWIDADGNHVYVNQSMSRQLGYTQPELLQMSVMQIDPSLDLATWQQKMWPLAREQGSVSLETLHRRKDGSIFPVEVTGTYLEFQGQEYICAVVRDISSRKAAENDLQRFKALADNALDAVAMTDPNAQLIYGNLVFQQMISRDNAGIEGLSIVELYPVEVQATVAETIIPAVMERGAWQGILEMLRPDGSRFLAQHNAFAIRDTNGNIVNFANVLRDVTAQKQAEDELRTFKTVVENTPDAIAMGNCEGLLLYGNPAFNKLFGYTGDQLRGMPINDVYSPEEFHRLSEILGDMARNGSTRGTIQFRRRNGSIFPGHYTVFGILNAQGEMDLNTAIIRDQTDEIRAEAERAALQQQLIDAQRDALRELSTPLIPITDDVVIMPLIGTIDSGRAQQVMETLLEGVARHNAELVILDITGVAMVDTQVAQSFIQAAQAVQLLGARVMLTGIQPHIAQTLVSLGVDLSNLLTRGSLQSGVAAALQR
jgi:rsbT co-antagonist protein RsbR